MGLRSRYAGLSRVAKAGVLSGALLGAYALLGFVVIPALIRWKLPAILQDATGRQARIEQVRLNPFALSLTARGFVLEDRDGGPLVAFEELYVNFELASLYHRAYTFREISLQQPSFHLQLLADGTSSIADLLEGDDDAQDPADAEAEEEGAIVPLIVHSLHLDGGRFSFGDASKQPPFDMEVGPIDVSLRDFVTVNETGAPYEFEARTADDQSLQWQGEISVSPLRSHGKLAITGIRPRNVWKYFRDQLSIEVAGGTVDVSADYDLDAAGDTLVLTLDDGAAAVRDLDVVTAAAREPVLAVPRLEVKGVALDLGKRSLHVSAVASSDARLSCALEPDGTFSYARLFQVGSGDQEAALEPTQQPADTDDAAASGDQPGAAWDVVVDSIGFDGVAISFADQTTEPPALLALSDLALHLDGVTTQPGTRIGLRLDTSLGSTGRIRASGKTVLDPVDLDLDLDLSGIELATFQPYVDPIARVTIESGNASLEGKLVYRAERRDAPMLEYRGGLGVEDLATKERTLGSELVGWKSLRVDGVDLDVEPTAVRIETITLAQPRVKLVIAESGAVNVADLGAAGASGESAAPAPPTIEAESTPPQDVPLSVGSLEIDDGAIAIVDRSVRPPFRLTVDHLSGNVRNVSSDTDSRSTVDLRADVGGGAPIAISGSSNLLATDAFTDLTFSLRDLGMTEFSPYTGKYVGRAVERGKLSLDLDYELDHGKLVGKNGVRIDQFDFGRTIDSPDATSLPVGLAVALLRDTSGRIKVDLPVSGNVDDPEFSLGGLLLGAVVNLITKAAASPFAIIGGIVGLDAEDLEYVAFSPGSAELTAVERGKLDALAKALSERPTLRLEVQGVAAPAVDEPALRESALDARLRAARFEQIRDKRDAPATADEVVLDDEQTFDLLEQAYRKAFDEKPKALLAQMPQEQSEGERVDEDAWLREQMHRHLLDTIAVDENDVRDLANRRAGAIRGYLAEQGAVAPDRIFLRDGNLSKKTDGDEVRSKLALAAG